MKKTKKYIKEKSKNQKGITLVVLVITIVILIILSSVTINAVLGDNGLIKQAKESKESTEGSISKEEEDMNMLKQEYANKMAEDSEIPLPEEDGPREVEGVTIPDGFYYVGGSKVDGIVISDKKEDLNKGPSHEVAQTLVGNQFVWIPVEEDDAFKWYEGYFGESLQSRLESCSEPYNQGYSTEESEFNAMKSSVLEHDGFYVGRYEAGIESETPRTSGSGIIDPVVIKQGKNVYNYVGWSNSNDMTNELGGAVELSKGFAEKNGYTSVTSTLVYGIEWDAIMNFIDPKYATGTCGVDSFVRDSTGKGNYDEAENTNPWRDQVTTTGASSDYAVKNIYDLGGNISEWTMEAGYSLSRVIRGRCLRQFRF